MELSFFKFAQSTTNAQLIPTGTEGEQIVSVTNNNATITRTYKAKNHSTTSTVVGLDNRRLVDTDEVSSNLVRVYESDVAGTPRIWVQFKSNNSSTWSNEFMLPLCEIDFVTYSGARKPRIATTRGNLWVVYQAYDPNYEEWRYVATLVHNVMSPQRQFQHKELYTSNSNPAPITANMDVSISGDNTTSAGSYLALAWHVPGTATFDISVLSSEQGITFNPALEIQQIFRTGSSYYPDYVQYGLDIAINEGKIGIASIKNSALRFRQAQFSIQQKTLTWQSGPTSVTGSFSALNYAPSIIAWEGAFRVAWSGLYFTSGNPNVLLWRNIGSTATNTTVKYLDMKVYGYGVNHFEGIQLTRINSLYATPSRTNNPYVFALTTLHNFTSYPMKQMRTVVVTNENNPSAVSFSVSSLLNVDNRSVATFSQNNKVACVYASTNQSLYKLNEINTPSFTAKGVSGKVNLSYFSAATVNYKKGTKEYEQFYIQAIQGVEMQAQTDSVGSMWLSDWFTLDSAITLSAYSSDKARLPFSIHLVNKQNEVIAQVQAKGENMMDFNALQAEKIRDSFRKLVIFGDGTREEVRIKIVPKTNSEIHLSQILVPIAQEVVASDETAEVSDWTQFELPTQIKVDAYPNPFNPSTTIRYSLPQYAMVTISVYDVAGKLVQTLLNTNKQAGNHTVSFQAGHLASGVYLVRVQLVGADGTKTLKTQQITLIK